MNDHPTKPKIQVILALPYLYREQPCGDVPFGDISHSGMDLFAKKSLSGMFPNGTSPFVLRAAATYDRIKEKKKASKLCLDL
jgi:hypothetical protein